MSLENDADRPKRVKTETAEVERHSLGDQIEADKYLAGKAAKSTNKLGIRFRKFKPPGMVPGVEGLDVLEQ